VTIICDSIYTPIRFVTFTEVGGCFDQSGFFQPVEGGLNLGRFHIPCIIAHHSSENRVEFITVTGLLGEETEDGVTDRHRGA
jgi:hypothetical protein